METGTLVMMVITLGLIWGGFAVLLGVMIRRSGKEANDGRSSE